MKNNILVTGGTGKTGRKVVAGLRQRQQNVIIGSRTANPSFDWNNPTTWPGVLKDTSKVYMVYHPDLAVPGALATIKEFVLFAKEMEVEKVVLLSGKGEQEAERCEQVVMRSGLDYIIVRASWFSQNFSESFLLDPILAGHVALPMPEAKIPFVDTGDIANVVVEALLNDLHNGKIYELTGPEALTFEEAINIIADASGKEIGFQAVSLEEYNALMTAAGVPTDYIWLFDYLFREVLGKESNQEVTRDIEKVLGREATSFQTYARRTAPTGVWNQSVPQSI